MCRKIIVACVRCEGTASVRNPNALCKQRVYTNALASAWLLENDKKNRHSIRNAIKYTFCDGCLEHIPGVSQREMDDMYMDTMVRMTETIRRSCSGSTNVRFRMDGIIFVPTPAAVSSASC
jgi:RNase P subunit RPR2